MPRGTKVMWVVVLLVAGVAAAAGYGYGAATGAFGNADRSQHVAANEALLRQVPVYPGARYATTWTHESKEDNGWPEGLGPITSYYTTHVYALDIDAQAGPTVTQWYRSHLAGLCQFNGGSAHREGEYFSASFRCGRGLVFIDPSNESLLIRPDHNAYDDLIPD